MQSDTWQLQEAKARFSHLVRKAGDKPQRVTKHGEEAAYVVSPDVFHEYEMLKRPSSRLAARKQKPKTFTDVMKTFPKGVNLAELIGPRSTIARATDDKLFD